jgi:hypothetical protein
MKKLLRVCVAVGLALGVFLLVGCGDDKGVGPRGGDGTTTGGTQTTNPNGDQLPDGTGNPCDVVTECMGALTGNWLLSKESPSGQSLEGTWRLSAIVDIETGAISPAPVQIGNDDKSYTLEFKAAVGGGDLITRSSVNTYYGYYTDLSRSGVEGYYINILEFWGTKVGGGGEGDDLWRKVFPTITTYALQENDPATYGRSLKLFYNNNTKYLLFRVLSDGLVSDPVVKGCGGDGLFKKNCGVDGSGLRSDDGDTVTVVSGR